MIKKIGFCMLLLACAAAFETYDEHRAFGLENGDEMYNEENYDYQDFGPYRPEIRDDTVQSLMLYKLFNALQNRDEDPLHIRYRPKFSMMENPVAGYGHVPYSELMDFKGAVAKRHGGASGSSPVSGTANGHEVQPGNPKRTKQKGKNVRKEMVYHP